MKDTGSTEFQMHIGLPSICSAADIMVAISKKNPANKKFKPHMTIMKVSITCIGQGVLFSLTFFVFQEDITMRLSQTIADHICELHNSHILEGEKKTFLEQSLMRMKLIQFTLCDTSTGRGGVGNHTNDVKKVDVNSNPISPCKVAKLMLSIFRKYSDADT
jgi:hypothetical protein